MASSAVATGPTAERVAQNIRRIRRARNLDQKEVSALLKAIGRSMLPTVLSKIERGERRIDVDDLVAIALVLNVSPAALLLPPESGDRRVKLTDSHEIPSRTAWQWAEGQRTAMDYEPGPIAHTGPGGDPAMVVEKVEREQEFDRQQTEYLSLTHPPERQRGAGHQAVRLGRDLADVIEDIVAPEVGADRSVLEARSRMAKRRYVQLGLELDEIIDHLPPAHPGMGAPAGE
ncbi:helix-turn-helix transcriptional regulator [Streptomyces mirabilis]|uniref:helix-turn-helix domain-containing protein n=1 Tax=Streptomyces sp. NPDC005388 TaxID=3156717 RepID=UPI0033B244B6